MEADDLPADLAANSALAQHVRGCAECRQLIARLESLGQAARSLPAGPAGQEVKPSAAFLAQVTAMYMPARAPARMVVPQRLAPWMRRAVAAAIILMVGLTALTLCLFNGSNARADTLLSDLAAWNLQITESRTAADRTAIYQQRAAEMKQRLNQVALSPADRQLAEALLDTAGQQAASNDPLETGRALSKLAEDVHSLQQSAASQDRRATLDRLYQQLSQGARLNLQQVDPSKLTPADRQTLQPQNPHDGATMPGPGGMLPRRLPDGAASSSAVAVAPLQNVPPYGTAGAGPGHNSAPDYSNVTVVAPAPARMSDGAAASAPAAAGKPVPPAPPAAPPRPAPPPRTDTDPDATAAKPGSAPPDSGAVVICVAETAGGVSVKEVDFSNLPGSAAPGAVAARVASGSRAVGNASAALVPADHAAFLLIHTAITGDSASAHPATTVSDALTDVKDLSPDYTPAIADAQANDKMLLLALAEQAPPDTGKLPLLLDFGKMPPPMDSGKLPPDPLAFSDMPMDGLDSGMDPQGMPPMAGGPGGMPKQLLAEASFGSHELFGDSRDAALGAVGSPAASAAPEPATCLVLVCGVMAGLRRRRKPGRPRE